MLNLIFSKHKAKEGVIVHPDSRMFFSIEKKAAWFQDPYVQEIIEKVDGATVVDGMVLKSRNGEIIPPEYLSTGSKTAICVYEFQNDVFNATQMGDNALYFALRVALQHDITLLTYHILPEVWLRQLKLQKDYKPVVLHSDDDDEDFIEQFEHWLEEGLQDD